MQTILLMHLQMRILRRMKLWSLVIGLLYWRFQSGFSAIRAKGVDNLSASNQWFRSIISYGLESIMKLTLPATKLLLHTAQRALEWISAKRLPVHQPRKALNGELLGSSTFWSLFSRVKSSMQCCLASRERAWLVKLEILSQPAASPFWNSFPEWISSCWKDTTSSIRFQLKVRLLVWKWRMSQLFLLRPPPYS